MPTEDLAVPRSKGLDKDLKRVLHLERATRDTVGRTAGLGIALLFLLGAAVVALAFSEGIDARVMVVAAAAIGGYMALNIGANDVANNIGPAVGARALTMLGALLMAAIFEAAGALLAGDDVVATISKGIVDPALIPDSHAFVLAMMAALLAAAVWLNFATAVGAPVSTTHSIVGGVMGAGVAAADLSAVDWPTMGTIAASWVISPALGGLFAALLLAFVRYTIFDRAHRLAAACRWVPIFVAAMTAAFTAYILLKGLQKVWSPGPALALALSLAAFAASWAIVRPAVARASLRLEDRPKAIRSLFRAPLVCAAALLSFAHGANDVANAVGPLAAIVHISQSGPAGAAIDIPLWVMAIGAAGICFGLFLFGPKLIRTVGDEITRLNPVRGFCVALSAATTVIAASAAGLPVSSTHIAVGAIFGVGFYREACANRRLRDVPRLPADSPEWLRRIEAQARGESEGEPDPSARRRKEKKARKRRLVRRSHLVTIVAAWCVTVPLTAIFAAGLYALLSRTLG
jgi:PiT family inorganic phosphate transporter